MGGAAPTIPAAGKGEDTAPLPLLLLAVKLLMVLEPMEGTLPLAFTPATRGPVSPEKTKPAPPTTEIPPVAPPVPPPLPLLLLMLLLTKEEEEEEEAAEEAGGPMLMPPLLGEGEAEGAVAAVAAAGPALPAARLKAPVMAAINAASREDAEWWCGENGPPK